MVWFSPTSFFFFFFLALTWTDEGVKKVSRGGFDLEERSYLELEDGGMVFSLLFEIVDGYDEGLWIG